MSGPSVPEQHRLVTYRGVVYPWQCDHMGHMNVMWYVGKFDEATWQLFGALGLSPSFLRENQRGMAAVEQNIQYKRELLPGDRVTIRSAVAAVMEKAARISHEMRNDDGGEVAALCTMTAVHLDTVARRACVLPPWFRDRVAALAGPDD